MDEIFDRFAEMEINLWAKHSRVVDKELLVKVSGSLRSSLAHHANQPSNTTLCRYSADVADETNPYIAMIMSNAFKKGHALMYDRNLRSEEKSEAIKEYPEDIIQCHEAFIQSVRESSEAKVEVVHGARVRERMVRQLSFQHDVLPLWGHYKGVSIFLDRECNYKNKEKGHHYRRIIVFVPHPQSIFYAKPAELTAQDRSMEVAAGIARTNLIRDYSTDGEWRVFVPKKFTNLAMNKHFGIELQENTSETSSEDTMAPIARNMDKDQDLDSSNGAPSSITKSKIIVSQSLAEIDSYVGLEKLENSVKFHPIIQEWLSGQKHVLFKGTQVGSKTDEN